ncbi:hypothetical protein ACFY3N_32175 [Streptomyces sp. NPDC000348]|uniref:hypothetical protein n=1 Tax=Streptomyces sp. NPDC000348 TaxID=3364538 RepID=UPI00369890C8
MGSDRDRGAVRAAIEGEPRLMAPAVRSSPAEAVSLLDPEFTEVGASRRSSLWRKHDDRTGRRMYHHRGIPVP